MLSPSWRYSRYTPLVIDLPAFAAQQDVDAEVAVAHPRRGQFPNPPSQHGLVVAERAVAVRRTVESQHPRILGARSPGRSTPAAGPARADAQASQFLQHVLQHQLVEREIGDQLFEPAVLLLELLQPPKLVDPQPPRTASSSDRTPARSPPSPGTPPSPASRSPPGAARARSA